MIARDHGMTTENMVLNYKGKLLESIHQVFVSEFAVHSDILPAVELIHR